MRMCELIDKMRVQKNVQLPLWRQQSQITISSEIDEQLLRIVNVSSNPPNKLQKKSDIDKISPIYEKAAKIVTEKCNSSDANADIVTLLTNIQYNIQLNMGCVFEVYGSDTATDNNQSL